MKRNTALKSLFKVLQRIHNINGVLNTPMDDNVCCKIKKAWLFGSVLKGSDNPNDIDIFIEIAKPNTPPEKELKSRRKVYRSYQRLHGGFRPCRRSQKWRMGKMHSKARSCESFIIWVRKHIPKVSIHVVGHDAAFETLDQKCLIYPRCDFDFEGVVTPKFIDSIKQKRYLP
jgi:predicted nucleotidyltransferase